MKPKPATLKVIFPARVVLTKDFSDVTRLHRFVEKLKESFTDHICNMYEDTDEPLLPEPRGIRFEYDLLAARAIANQTQAQAARTVGVSERTYRRWEKGLLGPLNLHRDVILRRLVNAQQNRKFLLFIDLD